MLTKLSNLFKLPQPEPEQVIKPGYINANSLLTELELINQNYKQVARRDKRGFAAGYAAAVAEVQARVKELKGSDAL